MSLGSQTQVVDGQRFTMPSPFQFAPSQYGPQSTGVPQVSPTMPPFIGASNGAGSAMGAGAEGVNGYGTAGNNAQVTQIAAEHPYNLKVSPTLWAVVALVAGILMLRGTAWRHTTLESASVKGDVAGAGASAREEA